MIIDAQQLDFQQLNQQIRMADDHVTLENVCGQRFIAAGSSGSSIAINGIPGNALGAYLNGTEITVYGNAQDAVGDTMNEGTIIVHGNIGDAAGYAMRGGEIYVRGNAGYRAGIHMKEYREKRPVMVIGGSCGSFLGEYQAGGMLIILGLDASQQVTGNFPCTGMHGGKVFIRTSDQQIQLPKGVTARFLPGSELNEIHAYIHKFCEVFGESEADILHSMFMCITPDSKNPYKQMYVAN